MKYLNTFKTPWIRHALNMWYVLHVKAITHELLWCPSFYILAIFKTYSLCSSESPYRFKLEKCLHFIQSAPLPFCHRCVQYGVTRRVSF